MRLENSRNISISAKNNGGDIARFVESEVNRLISKGLLLDGNVSSKFRRKIVETLINGAQGMFRWVELSLEALKQIKFRKDFKAQLGQLPSKLSDLYDMIHTQIDRTEPYGRKVAIVTLKWLLCAQRLLSVSELIAAISVVDEDTVESSSDSDEDNHSRSEHAPSPENDIIRLCRNLVVMDSEKGVFRFAHQSVRDYLLSRQEYTVAEQHALATERCLDVYLAESGLGSITPKMAQQNHVLKPYAEVYWPVHYKYIEDYESHELLRKVSRFTKQGSKTSPAYLQWASDIRSQYRGYGGWNINNSLGVNSDDRLGYRLLFASSRPHSYLSAACAFGFLSFMKDCELSSTDWNRRQSLTLLLIAAEEGHDQVVQMLLDKGADVNAQDEYFGNALQAALSEGHDQVVQMRLDKGADVNAQGGEYGNALHAASYGCRDEVMRLLLNHNAILSRKDMQGRTPSHLASARGRKKTVAMLSSFGSDPTIIDKQGRNCLHHAASAGSIELVNWLLQEGFDPNLADRDGWTSLHWAAKNGSVDTIEVLKIAGASSTIEAIEGWTPHSVTVFHHNKSSSTSDIIVAHEDVESGLAVKWSTNPSVAAVESTGDESKVSPGIWHQGVGCDGCLLVSFGLYNLMNLFD